MNPEREFDLVMRAWADAGEDRLPMHNLHLALADVAHTGQRAARPTLLELFTMRMQSVALPVALAAVLVLAAGALALVGRPWLGDDEVFSPSPSAATSAAAMPSDEALPTARDITSDDLRRITYADSEIIMGVDHVLSVEGRDALGTGLGGSAAGAFDPEGFVDARYDEFAGLVAHDSRNRAVIGTYALLLDSVESAEEAYRFIVEVHESPDGWGLVPSTTFRDPLGDEAVSYQGPAYERGQATIFLWRVDRMVLMAFGVEDTEPLQPLFVARRMDDQAR
ncbi:MAG TPA: hypothetical protein VLA59_06735 [Patescibacteria group bacterium]|nr:hypothetical protein [Patescibacteria group bacterium]